MLTLEIMGLLGLAILWVNTLLVVGACFGPLRTLFRSLRDARSIRSGTIVAGAHDGELAAHVTEQTGRKAADDDGVIAILFHDRGYRSEVYGGAIEIDGERIAIDPRDDAEVWIAAPARSEHAACRDADVFQSAYRASKKAKGYHRDVRVSLAVGDTAWTFGGRVADHDPRAWLRRKTALVVAFQLGMLAVSGGITLLCLWPPIFGTISTIGGVLALLHFLLVLQPFGVWVRESVRLPHLAILRGSWLEPTGHFHMPTGRSAAAPPSHQ